MNVLQIYDGDEDEKPVPGNGAAATITYYISRSLREKGHDVTVAWRSSGRGLTTREYVDGIQYVGVNCSRRSDVPYEAVRSLPLGPVRLVADYTEFAVKLLRQFPIDRFDVLHAHYPFSPSVLVTLRPGVRGKTVYTAHVGEEKRLAVGSDGRTPYTVFSPDVYLMKRIGASVVLNDSVREKLVRNGLPDSKLEAIPNGVDPTDFEVSEAEVERVEDEFGLRRPTVMFAGNVIPRKGVHHLLEAADRLDRRDVEFLIVGDLEIDAPYAERLRRTAEENDLPVWFTGYVDYRDLVALYHACDVFVLPSHGEGSPIVLMEALAAGKPLVGSNVGGVPTQVREGENGFLFEPGDVREMTQAIERLLEDEQLRERMGDASSRLASEEFAWERITDRYLDVYGGLEQ